MGKRNFTQVYQRAVQASALRVRPPPPPPNQLSIKITSNSDHYNELKDFAGLIVYNYKGEHTWTNFIDGHHGCSFFVLFLDTSKWPPGNQRDAGRGRVHDYIYQQLLGEHFTENNCCCGGFAVMHGESKFSSIWLNESVDKSGVIWQSDESKYLCAGEQAVVKKAIHKWKTEGPGSVFYIGQPGCAVHATIMADEKVPAAAPAIPSAPFYSVVYEPVVNAQRSQSAYPAANTATAAVDTGGCRCVIS